MKLNQAVIVVLILTICNTSYSQHLMGGYYKGEYREEAIEKLYDDLDLTQEQREQLKEKRLKHRKDKADIRQIAIDKKKELSSELGKEKLDQEKINKVVGELKHLEAQMIDQRIEGILTTREILTHQQYKKFKEKTEIYKKHRYTDWGKQEETQKQEAHDE